jgi:integrase
MISASASVETDLNLARLVASRKNEEQFARRAFPDAGVAKEPALLLSLIDDFAEYLEDLSRTYDHIKCLRGRLRYLARWMEQGGLTTVQDITPHLLQRFQAHLRRNQSLRASTVNHYLSAVHNFHGFAAFKRGVVNGSNPAATGRQAVLDKLPMRTIPPPTIYPEQVNAVIGKAAEHHDRQILNLVVFVCEGGFRFQELQFLQFGDIDLVRREIILDVKRPDPSRVRPDLRKRCLTGEGYWVPKTRASRRPLHVTDRLAKVIGTLGKHDPTDWVFTTRAGSQIAENRTLMRLKRYALAADVLVAPNPRTGKPWSLLRWHGLRHYHRTRAHVSNIRREVSKLAMGHAADGIHDHYRGVDAAAFHREYAKFDSGIDERLLDPFRVVA